MTCFAFHSFVKYNEILYPPHKKKQTKNKKKHKTTITKNKNCWCNRHAYEYNHVFRSFWKLFHNIFVIYVITRKYLWSFMGRRIGSAVRYQSNFKLGRFRSHLGASSVSSYSEELWYKETIYLLMATYIFWGVLVV